MKRNKWMRIASVLLVAALISTCAISGTFAKYVTEDSAYDSARVAKFGVTVLAGGKLFADSYKDTTNTPGAKGDKIDTALSVVEYHIPPETTPPTTTLDHDALFPNNEEISELVAPGTKNETGLTFTIAGKPEVDTKVVFGPAYNGGVKVENAEIVLKEATNGYGVAVKVTTEEQFDQFKNSGKLFKYASNAFTDVADADTFAGGEYYVLKDLTKAVAPEGYKPVAFQLKVNNVVKKFNNKDFGTLKQIEEYLYGLTKEYEANTDLATALGKYNITWKWEYVTDVEAVEIDDDFDDTTDPVLEDAIFDTDRYDTILGNLIALATAEHSSDSPVDLGYKVVRIDSGIDEPMKITEVKTAVVSDDCGIEYYYAYTGDEPEAATAAEAIEAANVAVLTTAFGMNIRVTQLD